MSLPNNAIIRFKSQERIEEIINKCSVCNIAMVDDGKPYIVSMNFGYGKKIVYLHSDKSGHKIDVLKQNNNVCIMFYADTDVFARDEHIGCSWRMRYKSVIINGKLEFIEDFDQKKEALDIMMRNYTDIDIRYSKPAIDNVLVMKVPVETWSGRSFEYPNNL
ncbi:MAG: pyridoxamine 5'-phosphate oxidase family protein [Bacteroidales bacterium]|nr:pyridoxamine 5'-phosphate oxidase family protein [Bacteroidales bacterium]